MASPLAKIPILELPPRTRRIQPRMIGVVLAGGTTSAHAENTRLILNLLIGFWNYLRARGEYLSGNRHF